MFDILLKLIESYLFGISQFVYYNRYRSRSFSSTTGFPQWSNLGLILFLPFINDLDDVVSTQTLCFGDVLKIFSLISEEVDCEKLQTDLKSLVN